MDATKEGGAMLRVEFPKGDYIASPPSDDAITPATPASAAPSPGAAPPAASSGP